MRRTFKDILFKKMQENKNIRLITADLGYKMFDEIRDTFPDRFINTGAAEFAACGVCVGLALEGKVPFFYSITPFLLARPYEVIRNYVDHESIPVQLIGGGRGSDYKDDGFSHYGGDDKKILEPFNRIIKYWPEEESELQNIVDNMANGTAPGYLNLKR